MGATRLTSAQKRMLAEIRATERGVLYVRRYSQAYRTVKALSQKGLVRNVEPDHSSFGADGWSVASGRS